MSGLGVLFLLWAVSKTAVVPARTVTGRSGRTYRVTAGTPGANFTTATVFFNLGTGSDVTLISYRQYTKAQAGKHPGDQSFKVGDRELIYRAPIAAPSPTNDPVADAVSDFGPYVADNGLT